MRQKRIFVKRGATVFASMMLATSVFASIAAYAEDLPVQPQVSQSQTIPVPGVGSKTVTFTRNGQAQSFVTPSIQNVTLNLSFSWNTAWTMPVVNTLACPGGGGLQVIIDSLSNDGSVSALLSGDLGDTSVNTTETSEQTAPGGGQYQQPISSGPLTHEPTGAEDISLTVCDT